MHRLLRASVALAVVAALAVPGLAGAQTKQKPLRKVTFMLNWYPNGGHVPFYYGIEKGFFNDEGIDLTIQPGGGSTQTIQAVAAGKVDFGYADATTLLLTVASGANVKSIGTILQTTPSSIEYFADKKIRSIADMRGKTVAGSPGDAPYETLPAVLEANHVPVDSVQRVNVDPAGKMSAVISGRVDSLAGFYTDQAETIQARTGRKVQYLRYADNGVNFYSLGVIASDDMLKSNRALAQAFMRATIRSWQEAAKHRAEAVDAEEKLAEKPPERPVLAKQFDENLQLLHTPATRAMPPGVNTAKDWANTISVVAKYLGLKNPQPPTTYWDPSIAGRG
jgi:NitT/TauT family transport system substrate-binding protein